METSDCLFCAICIILILLAINYLINGEHLGMPYYLNQMAMEYPDPVYFNYFGRSVRDVEGNSMQDYYLQNQLDSESGALPQIFNVGKFYNQDGYMDMPIRARPLRNASSWAVQKQAEIQGNNLEELEYQYLNSTGQY